MEPAVENAKKALSGLAVIVVGVLLALWADAAWAERGDRVREQEVLADLLDEFRENETLLAADIEHSAEASIAGTAWAEAMLGTAPVQADSLSALWVTAMDWARFDPVTGALRSVLDGGELGIILSRELRRALAGWSDQAEEARNTSQDMTTVLANLAPLVLSVEPGVSLTWGERSAILLVKSHFGLITTQQEPLLERLRAIIALLEEEIRS